MFAIIPSPEDQNLSVSPETPAWAATTEVDYDDTANGRPVVTHRGTPVVVTIRDTEAYERQPADVELYLYQYGPTEEPLNDTPAVYMSMVPPFFDPADAIAIGEALIAMGRRCAEVQP